MIESRSDGMLRIVQHRLNKQAKEMGIAMKTVEDSEHSVAIRRSTGCSSEHGQEMVHERLSE